MKIWGNDLKVGDTIYIVFCEKTPSFTVGMNRNVFRNKNNYFF